MKPDLSVRAGVPGELARLAVVAIPAAVVRDRSSSSAIGLPIRSGDSLCGRAETQVAPCDGIPCSLRSRLAGFTRGMAKPSVPAALGPVRGIADNLLRAGLRCINIQAGRIFKLGGCMLRETFAGIFFEFLARHRLASIAVAAHQSAVNRWCQGRLELADLLGDVFRPVMAIRRQRIPRMRSPDGEDCRVPDSASAVIPSRRVASPE